MTPFASIVNLFAGYIALIFMVIIRDFVLRTGRTTLVFFFGSGKEDYLDVEPKGLSFSILSTSIILQRTMLTLDFHLLRGFTRSLNKGLEMVIY